MLYVVAVPAAHEILAKMIETYGLPKAEIARRVGVKPQAVTNWTTGQAKPSLENLRKVEEILSAGGEVLRAYGYEVTGVTRMTTEAAIRNDDRFTDDDKEVLLRLVANFAAKRRNGSS